MRESAAPHRLLVRLADRAAVARDERRRDAARRPVDLFMNMRAEPRPQRLRARPRSRCPCNVAQHRPHRPDPVEPRALREIIAAGQARGRRRHQPRAHPDRFARRDAHALFAPRSDPHPRRQVGPRQRPDDQPHLVLGRQRLDAFDPCRKFGYHRLREHGRRDPQRPAPDQQQPESHHAAADHDRPPEPRLPADQPAGKRARGKHQQQPDPMPLGCYSANQAAIPLPSITGSHSAMRSRSASSRASIHAGSRRSNVAARKPMGV